jgi:acetate kinase
MGFTPLEGLVMATRSGSVDPGLVLWLEQHAGVSPGELADTLEHRSGLLGLAGSADLREILAAESAGQPEAALATGVYLHRLRAAIASMAAAMGGLDILLFTGGVGENAPEIRGRACRGLEFLGIDVDPRLNEAAAADCEIGGTTGPVRTLVIRAREDIRIAAEVAGVLGVR